MSTSTISAAESVSSGLPVGSLLTVTPHPISAIPKNLTVVRTAGCLIIGDEVLNGKTKDTNSQYLAKLFFDLGIQLKRVEIISDVESEIVEAVTRMSKEYDIVISSGGIGPTHDDITYSSIAAAFSGGKLEYDKETISRMHTMNSRVRGPQTDEQIEARNRMALFPVNAEVLFVAETLWVPVVKIQKVHILPGVPSLFERLLTALVSKFVVLPPTSEKPYRMLIHTKLPESHIAPFLTKLQARVHKDGISVGSYPKFNHGVDVSLIGKDEQKLKEISEEVIAELNGELVEDGKLGEEKLVSAMGGAKI